MLYPAIDLRGGRVVRLRQGDYDDETVYGDDPVAVATGLLRRRARRGSTSSTSTPPGTGEPVNRAVVAAVAAAVAGRASVQTGGGVRTRRRRRGARRRRRRPRRDGLGGRAPTRRSSTTVAGDRARSPSGSTTADGELAVHGWTEASRRARVADALGRFPAAAAFVITDIERDGMLGGPDVDGLAAAVAATDVPVIASGGVGTLDDVAALAAIAGLHGIITGRALYEGRFTVAEALDALAVPA